MAGDGVSTVNDAYGCGTATLKQRRAMHLYYLTGRRHKRLSRTPHGCRTAYGGTKGAWQRGSITAFTSPPARAWRCIASYAPLLARHLSAAAIA